MVHVSGRTHPLEPPVALDVGTDRHDVDSLSQRVADAAADAVRVALPAAVEQEDWEAETVEKRRVAQEGAAIAAAAVHSHDTGLCGAV